MTIPIVTVALFFGVLCLGFILTLYKVQKNSSQYVADLEFFISQEKVALNREKAIHSVLKTRFEKLSKEYDSHLTELESLRDREKEFNRAIARIEVLEKRQVEFGKLGLEITDIQETLNGQLKNQLSQYLQSVDEVGKRLHLVTHDFSEKVADTEDNDPTQVA